MDPNWLMKKPLPNHALSRSPSKTFDPKKVVVLEGGRRDRHRALARSKNTQRVKDEERMMLRINKNCAIWFKAEDRRNAREVARSNNPRRHPKWRKALATEALKLALSRAGRMNL